MKSRPQACLLQLFTIGEQPKESEMASLCESGARGPGQGLHSSQKSQGDDTQDPGCLQGEFVKSVKNYRKCRLSFHQLSLKCAPSEARPTLKTTCITKTYTLNAGYKSNTS